MSNDLNLIQGVKKDFIYYLNKGILKEWGEIQNMLLEKLATDDVIKHINLWYEQITNLSFLCSFPEDINEIYLLGPEEILYRKDDIKKPLSWDYSYQDICLSIEYKITIEKKEWNYSSPFLSFSISHNEQRYRVTCIHKSITSTNLPRFYIRKASHFVHNLDDFNIWNEELYKSLIHSKASILISGATGSGKTSFINTLLKEVNNTDHIVTLEDTKELIIKNGYHTSLLSDIKSQQTLDKLLSYSLRMTPDRIIVGELRSDEVKTFVQALNTGHSGLLSTIHANNAVDALNRTALLFQLHSGINMTFELALKMICSNLDYVIHLKDRNVIQVIKVFNSEDSNVFYDEIVGSFINTSNPGAQFLKETVPL
ncbi:MAG: CpaF/VirB11 family protein [Bacteriovoracaceae bacterium]|jgi:Flp pilus assembly CpaF family ATPase|nr:CpaF/VirB11 family protein [Bacteriovoracaceae bacterium]